MEVSKSMIAAFTEAKNKDKLDHVVWQDNHTTFTANLKQVDIDTIDLADAKLTYELYHETELVGEFDVKATVELTLKYESFFNVKVEPVTLLAQGLKDKSIKKFDEGYYARNGEVLGLIGEEAAVEKYLKGQADVK